MNKYFALRKANRMRTKLLNEKSQEQLKEVIRIFAGSVGIFAESSLCAAICLIFPSKPMRKIRNCSIRFRMQKPL